MVADSHLFHRSWPSHPHAGPEINPMLFASKNAQRISSLEQQIAAQQSRVDALDRAMAVVEFDLNRNVVGANGNFLSTMEYRLEEVLGQPHRRFCKPAYASTPAYEQFWRRLETGEFISEVFERITRSGRTVWLEASYSPATDSDGRMTGVIKYATDITQRVQKEREAQSRINAIERAMAVIEFNLDGTVIQANQNFLSLLGYSHDEVKGKHHVLFCPTHIAQSREYLAFWERLNKGEFFSGQFERVGKRGQQLWLEASYNPVYDAAGQLRKVVKFASDITSRIQKQDQDAQSAAKAWRISVDTRKVAERGNAVVSQTANEMRTIAASVDDSSAMLAKLGDRSEQITAIVKTIQGIADQTNLLALNAAIEAARAGSLGRGFAVVADEVRQLAARTSGSTAEISRMIEMIQGETRDAITSMNQTRDKAASSVDLADEAGRVIVQIFEGTSQAVDAVSVFVKDQN
jgi:methyl-accepting chemotaxis protein